MDVVLGEHDLALLDEKLDLIILEDSPALIILWFCEYCVIREFQFVHFKW